MRFFSLVLRIIIPKVVFIVVVFPVNAQTNLGIFDGQNDIGYSSPAGDATYDSQNQAYTISGSGSNIWFGKDAFHFVWKKITGNFILHTQAQLLGKGVEAHRKLGFMIRSSLKEDAPHACAVVHGDGLTSLQFRKAAGANMEELKMDIKGPDVIQLERKGKQIIMSVASYGSLYTSQQTVLDLGDTVYVGLFVCSHNASVKETASFHNVRITVPAPDNFTGYEQYIGSHLETIDVANGKSHIIFQDSGSIQAPNWLKDGKSILFNKDGLLYQLPLATNKPVIFNTGKVKKNNNDHVLAFDGKHIGLSSNDDANGSIVYTMPLTGGEPSKITKTAPSYLHGWSPDGKTLVFVGQRKGDFDIYSIPSDGKGNEKQLTTAPGLDDGCEYSPDGKYIYFNSVRTGQMQIWRMKPDGSEQTQLTNDTLNNWFPHISPDGKTMVFISFGNDVKPNDHPFYKHVYLRTMDVSGGAVKVLAYLYGGQGTINTPSWKPDGKQLAFVSNSALLFPLYNNH